MKIFIVKKYLESYGYRFLRINKFNCGKDPIKELNGRIERLVKNGRTTDNLISHIHETIQGLQNGEMKECPKCKEIRNADDFKDPSLVTGYGRFCKFCKGYISPETIERKTESASIFGKICPKCGSKMVLRSGRYGKFYGCSKFPYCRGTRQY